MDAGAKLHGYCSDITRTFPISGCFTQPQRELYEAVLRVQKGCIKALQQWPGLPRSPTLIDLHQLAVYSFVQELGILGFAHPENIIEQIFPHSLGHYLGMDLHDCQSIHYDEPLRPGMIITIEPGLYIPPLDDYPTRYHGIGIRIEDDILLTSDGCQVLTENAPKEVEELEKLCN